MLVEVDIEGGVARVRLNRPEKKNALTADVWKALGEVGETLLADRSVRVAVLSGEGTAFCSGIDLSSFGGMAAAGAEAGAAEGATGPGASIRDLQADFSWLASAPFVTIAKVHGYALGAGWQLALFCDFTIAAEGTVFGMLETNYGLIPDMGGTANLARAVGVANAKRLIFTGKRIDADEARRIGAVSEVVPESELDAAVDAAVAEIIRRSPTALRYAKSLIGDAVNRTIDGALEAEAEAQMACIASDHFREAISAFAAKREPVFR